MSVDKLQSAIRKLKNPSMVYFALEKSLIPPAFLETGSSITGAYCAYAKQLLTALTGVVPAVRFAFGTFAVYGANGLTVLQELIDFAKEQKLYVLLDAPEAHCTQAVNITAQMLFEQWIFDGLCIPCYVGMDGIKPYIERLNGNDKDLYVLLRTGNKSASELQDLLAGSRLLYAAAADMVKRQSEELIGKCGYSRIAGVGPATSADALQTLRSRNPKMFLLIDGYDYPGANAKNCSHAFDNLGHGAIACAGSSVVGAWQETEGDAITLAVESAERIKKNLSRYVAIL